MIAAIEIQAGQKVARLGGGRVVAVETLQGLAHLLGPLGDPLEHGAEGGSGRGEVAAEEGRLAEREAHGVRQR